MGVVDGSCGASHLVALLGVDCLPPAFWEKWQNREKDPVFFVARNEH